MIDVGDSLGNVHSGGVSDRNPNLRNNHRGFVHTRFICRE